jgi:soluble lytic murein transglycosylase-like protein
MVSVFRIVPEGDGIDLRRLRFLVVFVAWRGRLAGGRLRVWVILGVVSLAVFPVGVAGAQSPAEIQYETEPSSVGSSPVPELEARVGEQDAALEREIGEISAVGAELEEAQSRVDGARVRAAELREQTLSLKREIDSHREAFRRSKAGYEEKARAAYRGDHLEGLAVVLDGLLGSAGGAVGVDDPRLARILLEGQESLNAYTEAEQILQNTLRQISQKQYAYERALVEERERAEELRWREKELDESIARIGAGKARTEARLQKLEAAERARVLKAMPATGGSGAGFGYQMGIARDRITARSVEPIPYKEYVKLYRESAEKYGFGEDWYILAAVGKVESDHGANLGPSSAGAMGPMQFLPSTWETSGVDGNGDGVANIMDPEDAVPAAARYLKDGGAPRDWYRALYTYNHADWYVKKVLAVSEGYRRLAKDNGVGPYV